MDFAIKFIFGEEGWQNTLHKHWEPKTKNKEKWDHLPSEVVRSSSKSVETLSKATIQAKCDHIEQNLRIICKKFRWFFFNLINFLWNQPVSRNLSFFIVSIYKSHPVQFTSGFWSEVAPTWFWHKAKYMI